MADITAYGEIGKSSGPYPGTSTSIQFDDINPIWGPDGRTIAFERIYKGGAIKNGIYLFDIIYKGGSVIPVCESSIFSIALDEGTSKKDFYSSYFCWINIGTNEKGYPTYRYVYSKLPALYVGQVSMDPTIPPVESPYVSTGSSLNKYPDYSSKHGMITFVSGVTGGGDVYAKKYDDSFLSAQSKVVLDPGIRLTNTDVLELSPRWSPDGESIAYSSFSSKQGNMAICVVSNVLVRELRKTKQLTNSDLEETIPTWSPDGKMVAFYSLRSKNSIDEKDIFDICVVDVDKGPESVRVVAQNVYRQEQRGPVWMKLPDKSIIYTSDDYKEIHVVNVYSSGQNIMSIKNLSGYKYGNITDLDCMFKQGAVGEIWLVYSALNKNGQKRLYWATLAPKTWDIRREYTESILRD